MIKTCSFCKWTTVGIIQIDGTRFLCAGCATRMIDALERLRDGEFPGTPINTGCGAMVLIKGVLHGKDPAADRSFVPRGGYDGIASEEDLS